MDIDSFSSVINSIFMWVGVFSAGAFLGLIFSVKSIKIEGKGKRISHKFGINTPPKQKRPSPPKGQGFRHN